MNGLEQAAGRSSDVGGCEGARWRDGGGVGAANDGDDLAAGAAQYPTWAESTKRKLGEGQPSELWLESTFLHRHDGRSVVLAQP